VNTCYAAAGSIRSAEDHGDFHQRASRGNCVSGNRQHQAKKPISAGLYSMLQTVLLASIEKGQFAVAVLSVIIVVMLLKMPSADVGQLAFKLLDSVQKAAALGYGLAVAVLIAWMLHARALRRMFDRELARVTEERNLAQARCLSSHIRSSEGSPWST